MQTGSYGVLLVELATLCEGLSWRGGYLDRPPNVKPHYVLASTYPGADKVDEIGVVSVDQSHN